MTGDAELIDKPTQGFHILLGALPQVILKAILDVIYIQVLHSCIVDGPEVRHGRTVAAKGGFTFFMGGEPQVIKLPEGV